MAVTPLSPHDPLTAAKALHGIANYPKIWVLSASGLCQFAPMSWVGWVFLGVENLGGTNVLICGEFINF